MQSTISIVLAALGLSAAQGAASQLPVSVTAMPASVCYTERNPSYLNVDFDVHNDTDKEVAVTEIRASVLSRSGETIEKRLVWQKSLDLLGLGTGARVGPKSDGLIYNPILFNSARPGRRVRYEFDISGLETPSIVTFEPKLCRTKTKLILPIRGRVSVLDGHDLLSHHRRSNYLAADARAEGYNDNFERFALDLVVVDAGGQRFRSSGERNEDFYGWGQAVRAPGDGVIVASHDGQPDNDKIGSENKWTGRTWESSNGNYVIIRHNAGEFSVIDHMRQNSLRVRTGDVVHLGQIIGRVGNSGSSLMPHVHYQLQDRPGVSGTHGLPAYFTDIRFPSGETVPSYGAVLDSGDIVVAH